MQSIAQALGLDNRIHTAGRPEDLPDGCVVAVIGSGGKTTLLHLLARHFRRERVLMATTVKIRLPEPSVYDFFHTVDQAASLQKADRGITVAGAVLASENKLASLPADVLAALFPLFDKCFIEADGSRGLPFKGWSAHEPVVPDAATMTVAVVTAPPGGCTVTERFVHRLPLFCALSGARAGRLLRPEHVAAVIAHPEGLLKNAVGRIALFFNQAETSEAEKKAGDILALLPETCLNRLWGVFAGSARQDSAQTLWRRERE